MKMNKLGREQLAVSELCLGTMTWGSQDAPEAAVRQIETVLERGINFIDTAELYPVNPIRVETVGRTEEIIGDWIAANPSRRAEFVLATKVTGPSPSVRDGEGFSGAILRKTVEASLARLRTDYIDLYQLHWPMRGSYHFRQNWGYDPSGQNREETVAHMRDVLGAAQELVTAGKIRHLGLSNETAWGTMMWLHLAREMGAPEVISVQNEYSLMCRYYDLDMAELSANEGVRCLSYSPLAMGILSGKYGDGSTVPKGSRREINPELGGRSVGRAFEAAQAYVAVAQKHGLSPVAMALRWVADRPFMGSVIFGARNEMQLEEVLSAAKLTLSDEVRADLDAVHRAYPMPY
ncbi:MAG: aldo/keto reductase [Rhodobacterales bacterium]|nr:MAG: aldo/keto reductase [Rhodobacterales bacterium]